MRRFSSGPSRTSVRFQAVILLAGLILGLVTVSETRAEPAPPLGRFEARLLEIYRYGRHFSECDLAPNEKLARVQLARAFDDRARDFLDIPPAGRLSSHFDGIKIGSLKLKGRPGSTRLPESPASQTGWVSTFSGWADLEKEFRAIRKQPMNARWVRLRARLLETIAADEKRIFDGKWMQATSQGVEQAPVLAQAISHCLKDKLCEDLQRSENFSQSLSLTRNMKSYFEAYQKATSDKAKSAALAKLLAEVRPFQTYYEPVFTRSNIRFIDGNTLVLPVDAGDFEGYETRLASLISDFWDLEGNRILIEWMTSTRALPLFEFSLGDRFGVPSQVNLRSRRMTLSSDGYESTPANAIGQALGFRPRVFSVWRNDRCQYEEQTNPADLMSDARTGTVNKTHWESLKRMYGR